MPGEFDRAAGLGGSDIAVLLELSPWRDITDLWLEKTRNPRWYPQAETPAMRWGTLMEPLLRAEYERESGYTVRTDMMPNTPGLALPVGFKDTPTYWAEEGIRYAHLDGWVDRGDLPPGVWEGKTSSNPDDWADGVPVWYDAQVQSYMDIVRAEWCDVSVLLPRSDFRTYRIEADATKAAAIKMVSAWFWTDHVLPEVPVHELDPVWAYPVSIDSLDPVDGSLYADEAMAYAALAKDINRSKDEQGIIRKRLEEAIGDAPGMKGPGFSVSWKSGRPRREVNWEQVATAYENALHAVARFREHLPEEARLLVDREAIGVVKSLYTTERAGGRSFRVTVKED